MAPTGKDGNETEVSVHTVVDCLKSCSIEWDNFVATFSPFTVQVHTIKSVEDGGFTVTLERPLTYAHFGITESFEDGQFIDIRCVFSHRQH